jgi:hypothetical protein
LPQVLGPLRPPEFRGRDHFLPTRDFLQWRKFRRQQAKCLRIGESWIDFRPLKRNG